MRFNVEIVAGALIGVALMCLAAFGGGLKHPCPATQPGLILRDLEHPPSKRAADQEWIISVNARPLSGILRVGLNRIQAEGIAYQLNQIYGHDVFRAQKAMTVERSQPDQAGTPAEAK